jgi:hypothetical protein
LAQTEGDFLQRHAGSVTVAGGGLARMGIGLWVGAQRAASGDPLGGVAHIALTAAAGALTGTGLAAMVATGKVNIPGVTGPGRTGLGAAIGPFRLRLLLETAPMAGPPAMPVVNQAMRPRRKPPGPKSG